MKVTTDQGGPKETKKTTLEIIKPEIELTGLNDITHDARDNDHLTHDMEPYQSLIVQSDITEKEGLESSNDTRIQRTESTPKLNEILKKNLN